MNDPLALATTQRRELRARAHALHPVVMISEEGLSPGVLSEIERSLKSHELIKIRIFGADRDERNTMLAALCSHTGALPIQHIGKVIVIYRENPKKPAPRLTRPRRPLQHKSSATAHFKPKDGERKPFFARPASSPRPSVSRDRDRDRDRSEWSEKTPGGLGRKPRARPSR